MKSIRLIRCFVILALATTLSAQSSDVMARAEQHVNEFLAQISDVKCTETVEQIKLSAKGKPEYQERSKFDYLLLAQSNGGELSLDESRLAEQTAQHKKEVSLLVTNGFATQLLVFHPKYESGFEFAAPQDGKLDGREVSVVRFRHVKGMRTPTALMLRGREYPLEMMGTAWIEKSTGAIVRIETELQSSLEDIGLRTLRSDVRYAPVQFKGMKPMWLPAEAVIEVQTPRQHWRNIHHFADYQHFGVDTQQQERIPEAIKNAK